MNVINILLEITLPMNLPPHGIITYSVINIPCINRSNPGGNNDSAYLRHTYIYI